MEQNQPGTDPPAGRSSVTILLPVVFFVLAAILGALPSPPTPRGNIVAVDASFFDTAPRRKLSSDLMTTGKSKCTECHTPGDAISDIVVGKSEDGNHEKKLQHGRNDKCFHCHNPKNMETFQNRDGDPVAYKDVVELCTNCHGPQYRDWKAGIHGRRTGYYDLKRGEQKNLRCIECHDPHFPIYKSLKPAPGPHVLHGRVAGSPSEHPFGTPRSVPTSETPESSATPSNTPTEAAPSPLSATPNDQKQGGKP